MEWEKKYLEVASELGLEQRLIHETQLLAAGFKNVVIDEFNEAAILPEEELAASANAKWEEKKKSNPYLFDGALASIVSAKQVDTNLHLRLRRTRYSLYSGAKPALPGQIDLEHLDPRLPLPLSYGAVTVSYDGFIIFALRSKSIDLGNQYTTAPSGYFDPDKDRFVIGDPGHHREVFDPILNALREGAEELGVTAFSEFRWNGLIQETMDSKQPLLASTVRLPFSKEELKKRLRDMGFEIQKYELVENDPSAVNGFLNENRITPHDVAKLVLHFLNK